jgi:hypothetical protein
VAGVRERLRVRAVDGDNLIATGGVGQNTEGPTDLIRKFGNTVEFGVTLDLNSGKDKVANSKSRAGAAGVDTSVMGLATVGDNEGNDLTSKVDVGRGFLDVGKDRGAGVRQRGNGGVSRGEREIKREPEFATHSRNAADNVGAVNGTAVPGVGSNHGCFDRNKGCVTIGAGDDGDSLVEEAEEAFDANCFMVTTGCGMKADTKEQAGIGEDAVEGAAGINNNEAAHANFQQDFLE